jgi:hypothetical protein
MAGHVSIKAQSDPIGTDTFVRSMCHDRAYPVRHRYPREPRSLREQGAGHRDRHRGTGAEAQRQGYSTVHLHIINGLQPAMPNVWSLRVFIRCSSGFLRYQHVSQSGTHGGTGCTGSYSDTLSNICIIIFLWDYFFGVLARCLNPGDTILGVLYIAPHG